MYKSILCSTPSNIITVCLFLSLPIIILCSVIMIPNAEGEAQTDLVGINSTSTTKNSTYENSLSFLLRDKD